MRPEALFIDGPWDGKMRQIAGPGPIYARIPPTPSRDGRLTDASPHFVYRVEIFNTPTRQFYIAMPIHMAIEEVMLRLIKGYHKCPEKTTSAVDR